MGASENAVLQPKELRSEEHTSELQSHLNLVCRLLLEKKKIPHRHCTRSTHPTRQKRPLKRLTTGDAAPPPVWDCFAQEARWCRVLTTSVAACIGKH